MTLRRRRWVTGTLCECGDRLCTEGIDVLLPHFDLLSDDTRHVVDVRASLRLRYGRRGGVHSPQDPRR